MPVGDALNVRARAPLRLGLAGGGTDLAPYCSEFGGNVLNATIDRFAYAHVHANRIGGLVLRAHDIDAEEVLEPSLKHPVREGLVLHRAVYTHMMRNYCDGAALPLTIATTIDVPAGSGLGASSALVVALIEAFRYALRLPLGPYEVARLAFEIERVHIGLAGGQQDQYSAAFGGLNFIEFLRDGRAIVNPLRMRREHLNEFEASLVICFTGQSRHSETIIKAQVAGLEHTDARTLENMHHLKQDAIEMKLALLRGDLRATAQILGRSWAAKKATAAGVTSPQVERLHAEAMAAGAWAGKVSGAGGGGFLMFLTDPENAYHLKRALNAAGGEASSVKFTADGAEAWPIPASTGSR